MTGQLFSPTKLTMTTKALGLLLVCCLVFVGCASLQRQPEPEMPLSYHQKALFLLRAYNAQYADYKSEVASKDLNDQRVRILKRKLVLLKELHPLIGKYYRAVMAIGQPTPELEPKIVPRLKELLNDELILEKIS